MGRNVSQRKEGGKHRQDSDSRQGTHQRPEPKTVGLAWPLHLGAVCKNRPVPDRTGFGSN